MNTERLYYSPDRKPERKEIELTKDSLRQDNLSEGAARRSHDWEKYKSEGKLWGHSACADARILLAEPERMISVRSIGGAGEKAGEILTSAGLEFMIVTSHVDGDSIQNGEIPIGCGGLGVKKTLEGQAKKVRGAEHYVQKRIKHPDPIVQALITAREIRDKGGKSSIAVIQNHLTGEISPFAVFFEDYQIITRELDKIGSEYDPKRIYQNGLPILKNHAIPSLFDEYLEVSKRQVAENLTNYPHLREMQKVQNPRVVFISTKLPSVRIRYPKTFDIPGMAFKIHVPRDKEKGTGVITVRQEMIQEMLDQAQYAIKEANQHYGQEGKPFSETNRVIVETSRIDVSAMLASELAKEEWMQEWLSLPDHQIIVIQSQNRISNIIENFLTS